ncbi:nucleotidyltransferase [uncultured Paracoccus sp.]|uniref:nucleotidyltransferase domain-containing protein n=1 Tax=uncultured Paracoccus sp. TaxID=189685 RepID=UPI00261144A1|nr:nucleotidyltransferase [uncultured Paracoccus sp.]
MLEALGREIDIPEHLLEKATDRYLAVGRHLDRPASSIKHLEPEISPQGSILLGTVTRPIGDADEYDFDLVCLLNATKLDYTQARLKAAVGEEIKVYAASNNMHEDPDEGRRCWTLTYSDGEKFHMDILPAIPDRQAYQALLAHKGHRLLASDPTVVDHAIAITDKEHPSYHWLSNDWLVSNPKGYAAWFKMRQVEEVIRRKRTLVDGRVYASVEDVPDHRVKTPLQRAIQLLKRHRDAMFQGQDERPISVIITTLAAHAYRGENTIKDALAAILLTMNRYIEDPGGVEWVRNPVNPEENFADRWVGDPAREKAFYEWLDAARRDFGNFLTAPVSRIPKDFQEAMTLKTMAKVSSRIFAAAMPAVAALADEAADMKDAGQDHKPWAR